MTIEQDAIDHFGLTKNIFETGWILKNGEMLDFSGRKFGGNDSGTRYMDHREVSVVFPEGYKHTENVDGYIDPVSDFERETGALRISVQGEHHKTGGRYRPDPDFSCDYNLQLSTYQNPTDAQKYTLARIHRRCPQNWIDVYYKNNRYCGSTSGFRLTDAWGLLQRCKVREES